MLVLFLIISIYCAQEIELIRKTFDQVNDSQLVDIDKFESCPQAYESQQFNLTKTIEICQTKDLFYNLNLKLNGSETYFQMFIDLIGPWSWFKSEKCEFYNQSQLSNTNINKEVCTSNEYKNALSITQTEPKSAEINSQNNSLSGDITPTNITIGNYTFELEMLQINKIYSKTLYYADGALSFGVFDKKQNHSFLNKYFNLSQKNELLQFQYKTTKLRLLISNEVKDDVNHETFWYDNNFKNFYQWKLNINKVSVYEKTLSWSKHNLEAIITLNSQFISLPKELAQEMIKWMSEVYKNIKCFMVDSNHYILKCENMTNYQLDNIKFTLYIGNQSYVIKELKHSCSTNFKGNNDCLLKIKCSSSNTIFLGEPFFKERNVLLNYNTSQIGITREKLIVPPPKSDQLAISHLQYWVIFLTLLLILVFCLMNLKHAVKWFLRALRFRKTQNLDDEQQLRSKEVEFQGMEKSEEMTQSLEESSI